MTDTTTTAAAPAVAVPSQKLQPRLKQKYRDEITAQLTNVRQMLATLGGVSIVNPLADPEEKAVAPEVAAPEKVEDVVGPAGNDAESQDEVVAVGDVGNAESDVNSDVNSDLDSADEVEPAAEKSNA